MARKRKVKSKFDKNERVWPISPDGQLLSHSPLDRFYAVGQAWIEPPNIPVERMMCGTVLCQALCLTEAEYQLHQATKGITE